MDFQTNKEQKKIRRALDGNPSITDSEGEFGSTQEEFVPSEHSDRGKQDADTLSEVRNIDNKPEFSCYESDLPGNNFVYAARSSRNWQKKKILLPPHVVRGTTSFLIQLVLQDITMKQQQFPKRQGSF